MEEFVAEGELEVTLEESAKAGPIAVAVIKIPSNTNPIALILTRNGFLCLYISNYLKLINF